MLSEYKQQTLGRQGVSAKRNLPASSRGRDSLVAGLVLVYAYNRRSPLHPSYTISRGTRPRTELIGACIYKAGGKNETK